MPSPDALLALSTFDTKVGNPLINGLVNGLAFSLIAVGIVLIYKSNRVFNFAQAEFGTVAALTAAELSNGGKLLFGIQLPKTNLYLSLLIGLVVGTGSAVLAERLVIRPLFNAPRTTLLVATVGIALALIALAELVIGNEAAPTLDRAAPGLIRHRFLGHVVQYQELLLLGMVVVVALGAVFFFRTRYGLAILAVSQEPTAAETTGISVSRVSMLTWGLAGLLASIAGLLLGPNVTANPGVFTFTGLLASGFVAAVIGGLTSLPGAFLGGIVLGLVGSFGQTLIPPDAVPGGVNIATAGALILVLLIRPKGLLGKEA